ncbi:MAG TPA: hypothetical protein VN914_10455 [Polyangia bacterium]|nr:hypothetical protein [Polyangia bacterium]
MVETASETAAPAFTLAPLPVEGLSPAVQKLVGSPASAKLMAAKGIAPLRPQELLVAMYQMSFDGDATVKAAAEAGAGALPDKVLVQPLGEALPPVVLHFFAERIAVTRIEALEKILANQSTADATFVRLAARVGERETEIIVQNEIRLLRCPAIVQALFMNKQARMSSVSRAIELCARNNVRVDGIPAFDEIAKSIQDDPAATDPAVADPQFEEVLQKVAAVADDEVADEEVTGATKEKTRKSPVIDFTKLKLHEKIRLATLGNAYCRSNLIRDSNKMVALAVIRSPLITDTEVVRAAGNRQIGEDVIRYIANQRDFTKMYQVRLNLAQNPKCPLGFSLRFLSSLHNEDVKALSKSKNIPSALAVAARKLVQTRAAKND